MKDILRRVRRTLTEDAPAPAVGSPPPAAERTESVDVAAEPAEDLGADVRWVGYIDHIDRTIITGWCYDRDHPERSAPVEAIASNGKRVVTVAATFRQDVKDAGHGTGAYGFEIDVAGLMLKDETLMVRFADSKVAITKQPFSLDPQRSVLEGRLPSNFTSALRLLALDVRTKHAELDQPSTT